MAIITPDLSQVESGTIEPGTYPAKIVSADPGTSNSGSPKIVVKMEVNVGGKARPRTAHIVTSGKGAFNFDRLLRACRLDTDADGIKANPGSYAFDTDKLVGQELNVVIDSELYQGEARDQIKSFVRL